MRYFQEKFEKVKKSKEEIRSNKNLNRFKSEEKESLFSKIMKNISKGCYFIKKYITYYSSYSYHFVILKYHENEY